MEDANNESYPLVFYDNTILQVKKMEELNSAFKRGTIKQMVYETKLFIRSVRRDGMPDKLRNYTESEVIDAMHSGINILDEFYPNISLEVDNEIFEKFAVKAIMEF